ncbi:hypothetical protein G4D82_06090, partial [Flavobacterium sp. CYK-4]|uniref:choice-of-anchor L domain-containing protein n=1 Tax=Flavobacterium lotistagni TaxID=2709660 RepID=UPI00140ABE1A
MRKNLLVLFLLLGVATQAQLIINNTARTPASLVQDVLVGNGVVPFNIKFNRSAAQAAAIRDQAAEFSTNFNPTNLGLDAGILLTTGKATVANGANNAANSSDPTATVTQGDADLALLSGQAINNVALLEFDFVATGLVLNFDYVFASEEYPEWTASAFNDTFGFFLSGPGLAGPYAGGAINIALIPTTTTASNVVSIGNVNNGIANGGPCRNCTYYVANGIGNTPGANPHLQYDGFTRPLRATAPLICGQTYHIKLAIANAGPGNDNLFDSGVFIKNFRIEPLQLSVSGGFFGDTVTLCYGTVATINSGVTPSANLIKWYKDGVLIAGETTPDLPLTEAGVYTFEEYTPSGCRLAVDDITVVYSPEIPATPPLDLNLCTSAPGPYIFNIDQTARITSTLNPADYFITYYNTNAGGEATYGLPTGIIPDADLATYSISSTSATIYVRIEDIGTGSGCVSVKPFNLNVIPGPSGTISYSASPYCNNQLTPQSVTNTALTPGGTYSATPPGLIIDPNTGAITPFGSAVNTYTVKYEILPTGGCPYFSTTAPVTIDNCTCTVTASSTTQSVCVGNTITPITYTSSTGATTGSVPLADLPPGVIGSFSAGTFTVSGTPTTAGTYTFTVTLETGITDSCTATTTIEVKPIPTVSISGTTTVCSGDTAQITFTGTPGTIVNYLINNSGANQTIALNAAGTATLTTLPITATTTFDLVSVETGGTPNCSQTVSGSVTVMMKPTPTATISGTTTICSGTGTTVSFTGTPNAIVTYNIDGGANQTITLDATGNAGISTGNLTGDKTYNIVRVETGGIPNCSQVLTGSVLITVKPLPTATLSSGTTICSGTSTTLTITGTPGATVTYNVGTGPNTTTNLDASGNATINTGTLTTATTYNLISIDSNGTPNCSQSLTGSSTISITNLPTVSISSSTTICSGDTATITFTGTPNATVTYLINNTGSAQSITLDGAGTASFTTLPLTSTTTFDLVDVSVGASCSQTQTGSVTITVIALPTASISGATTICAGTGTTISFTGTSNAIVNYDINGGTSQSITLDATGNASIATGNLTSDTTYNILSVETGGTPNCSQILTGSVLVSVIQIPTATISGTTTICSGGTTTISFTGTPNATVNYQINASGANIPITL